MKVTTLWSVPRVFRFGPLHASSELRRTGTDTMRRAGRITVAAALTVGLTVGAGAAHASDGRAGNGRAELASLYQHQLGRALDAAGLAQFGSAIDRDCRQGLLTATYAIATSPEADAHLNTPDRKVNSLYAGLLDRGQDEDGWKAHHQSLLNGRSWGSVVTSVLASPEYEKRLSAICADAPTSNAMVASAATNDALVEQLLDQGAVAAFTCVTSKAVIALAKKISIGGLPLGQLAAEAGKITAKYLQGNDFCGQAARYFAAAAYGALVGASGDAVYWRTVYSWGDRQWLKLGGCDFHQEIHVGSSPTSFHTIEGTSFYVTCPKA